MATEVLVNVATEILKKLGTVIAREISLAWGVKDDLAKLRQTLEMISAVMTDAENRQINDNAVRLWWRRLKDVAYNADDILDDFSNNQNMRREMCSFKNKVCNFISSSNPLIFCFKMAQKIKDINRKLDEITKDMDRFKFHTARSSTTARDQSSELLPTRESVAFVVDSDIIGREDDKSEIGLFISNKYLRVLNLSGLGKPGLLAKLRHLRYLDLSNFDVGSVQSISSFHNLQTLVLHNCQQALKLLRNIGALKNLRHLDLSWIHELKVLPNSITNLPNLRTLNLSNCDGLEVLPRDVEALKLLRCLDISHTRISELPDSITKLDNLRLLKLNSSWNSSYYLKALPKDIGELKHLRCLDLSCTEIKDYPSLALSSTIWRWRI
ncbi:Leucine-rich repeat [Macleaya cordata]|uniref:Leucine-rich repeat n=1 Tax=Macleaya cordata TaxID=56857 RepID=A0A200R149_MACCD|nr:Leucine-rich repeat [Macleaya cordata]